MHHKFYNPKEAAAYLTETGTPFTKNTLDTWRSRGRGPAYQKIANRVFYTRQALDDFRLAGPIIQTADSVNQFRP